MQAAFLYILAVLAANFTATMFIAMPSFLGMEIPIAVGTFIFGFTFTQRDRMHYRGRRFVYKVILMAAVLNLLMMVSINYIFPQQMLALAQWMGSPWLAESFTYLTDAGLRVFAASFLAIILAEAADTEIYHRLLRRRWLLRVTGSNAVSVPLDSALFNLIAFAGIFEPVLILQLILGEVVVKYTVGALFGLYRSKAREQAEAERYEIATAP